MLEVVLMLNAIRLELQQANLITTQANAIEHGARQDGIDEATEHLTVMRQEADMLADQAIKLARLKEED